MNLLNIIKLSRVLAKLEQVNSDKGVLVIDDIEPGAEVYTEVDGEVRVAQNDDYVLDDKRTLVVVDGKIESIKDAPADVEPSGEGDGKGEGTAEGNGDMKDEKKKCMEDVEELNARISELEAAVADRDAAIAEKDDKIKSLEEEIAKLKDAPVETEMKKVEPHKWGFKVYTNK